LLLVLGAAVHTVSGQVDSATVASNQYIDEDDKRVSDEVAATRETVCEVAENAEVDRDSAYEDLVNAVDGENKILNIMKESTSNEEFVDKVVSELPPWLIKIAIPIILAFVVVIFYLFCCWTGCPCCKCCRCCSAPKQNSKLCKMIFVALLLVCLLAMLISFLMTITGYKSSRAGLDTMSCSAVQLLDGALNGETDPFFVGILPVFEKLDTLDKQFEDNSQLMTDVEAILAKTVTIQDAVTVSGGVLKLLGDMMELSQNVNPTYTTLPSEDSMHECVFCEQLAGPLQTVGTVLDDGVGTALSAVRTGVDEVLSPANRQEMQTLLREAADPLVDFKVQVRDVFSSMLDGGTFDEIKVILDSYVEPGLLLFFFLALILFIFSCCSAGCWVLRETNADGTFSKQPHRLACCVWGCAPFVVFPVMLLGGLLTAGTSPLSGVCLIMADIDSQMLDSIGPAIGMNISGDEGVMLRGMVDSCIATKNESLNANFMDIIFTRDAVTGDKVYVREELVSSVQAPLDEAFAGLDEALSNGDVSISNNSDLVALRTALGRNPLDAFLLPDPNKMSNSADFQPMLGDSELQVVLQTSSRCDNHTVVGDVGSYSSGQTMLGMEHFVTKLESFGDQEVATGTCLKEVTCHSTLSASASAACDAGNKFVRLLRKLTETPDQIFRCDIFQDAGGSDCDPIDMVQGSDGQWDNDCLIVEGSEKVLKPKTRHCNLTEFVTYVQAFDQRIENVMARLDNATNTVMTSITGDLRTVIDNLILDPVVSIVDGLTCGFLPKVYRGVIDGLCYQGILGFRMIGASWVVVGFAVILLAIVMYALWRRAIDNVNGELAKGELTESQA